MGEQIGAGVVPELVAAGVVEPAVVLDSERQRGHSEPLHDDQRCKRYTRADRAYELVSQPQPPADGVERRRQRRGIGAHDGAPVVAPACSRYHAIVRSSPSRSGVRASKPNSSRARVASRLRRGWPFGFERVPRDLAVEAGQLRDQLGQIADRDLVAGAEVDRLGAVVPLGGEHEPFDAVVDVEELARRRAVAPEHDRGRRCRASCGSGRESRATSRGRSCRAGRRGSRAGGRSS